MDERAVCCVCCVCCVYMRAVLNQSHHANHVKTTQFSLSGRESRRGSADHAQEAGITLRKQNSGPSDMIGARSARGRSTLPWQEYSTIQNAQ